MDPAQWVAFGGHAMGPVSGSADSSDTTQIRQVKQIITHPLASYTDGFYQFDVALIQLSEPFQLGESVKSICVAEKTPENGQMCITAGWSFQNENGTYT